MSTIWKRIHTIDNVWTVLDSQNRMVATVVGDQESTLVTAAYEVREAAEKAVQLLKKGETDNAIELLTSATYRSRRG